MPCGSALQPLTHISTLLPTSLSVDSESYFQKALVMLLRQQTIKSLQGKCPVHNYCTLSSFLLVSAPVMPSQSQNHARASPKKKTKRKAIDSDGQRVSTKRTRAGAEAPLVLQPTPDVANSQAVPPRRSGRHGAGQGGRASQLEIIGNLLGASTRTSRPKGSTSLDSDVPNNPLAPEPPRKGCGSHSKMTDSAASGPQAQKTKATKNAAPPALDFEAPNLQPRLVHHEAGARFGFAQHIVPPGTEPDLQALNNSYVAAAREKQTSSATLGTTGHLPIAVVTSENQHSVVPSNRTLPAHQSDADSDLYQNLDPALRPVNDERFDQYEPQDTRSDSSGTSSEGGDGSASDEEADHTDDNVGWGAAHGRMTAHPGFSKEDLPSQPRVALALPTNFEFQHSRDEGDNDAERSLVANNSSSDDDTVTQPDDPQPDDVLQLHHKKNGRPRPRLPDPQFLELLHHAETKKPNHKSSNTQAKTALAKSDEPGEGPKATQLGWYGPRWKSFLEDTKGECRVQHAIENPFPKLVKDLTGSVNEVLMASLVEWLESGQHVEEGIWPDHKHDMAKLLYEDLSTWRSDLKKIVINIVPSMYNLIPPPHIPPQQRAAWVTAAAGELLEDAKFLRNGLDDLGKTQNAAHPALREAVISFFYTSSYRVARRRPEIFRTQLPLECLALVCTAVNCVLDGLAKNGSGKSFPKFTAKEYGRNPTRWMAASMMLRSIRI
ncbi:hypothetical protein DEU56DRAFT_926477 [Suillus clintonianus]|uniref:uncharacterized protein n=1 Tax=Suillus clintonianus TaxID=1904413 RepID=UPI001B85DCC8|nr:uncharacterized protein DEU56DRAFT_926477 [Suillus clintonianus]KAG2148853.1 hypothetical protein DEU56DRAFT_926477 [Suillus clintonianus]